jgi:hypothetical protein
MYQTSQSSVYLKLIGKFGGTLHATSLRMIFLLLIFSFTGLLFSAEISLNATVDKNQVGLNGRFIYTIEVIGKSASLPKPDFPTFENFTLLSGPNTSTNIQFINGAMSASNTYTFYLRPQREGKFSISPATLEVDDETISSNQIEISVVKGTAVVQPQKQSPKSRKDEDLLGENLYLKAFIDKNSVYQNQQLLVEYKLYFRVDVRSYNIEKVPANPGFWMEEFKLPSQPRVSNEIINGVTYRVATLRKIAFFPTRSGELTIEPMAISLDAVVKQKRRSRSIFDDFFDDPFGRTVKTSVSSQALKINVKQLPQKGRPADFEGVVGRYSVSLKADKKELKANEAVSIKFSIKGDGNVKLLKAPKIDLPADMEIYDPKEKTNITRENNLISGSKVIEYVLVPRFKGEYTIDPISFSYYDPLKSKYVRLKTDPISLSILEGDVPTSGLIAGSSLSKQEVELLGEDIRYIKESAEFYRIGRTLYKDWIYLISYFIPLIGLVLAWRYSVYRNQLRGNVGLARRRKAGKIVSKHLTRARQALKLNNREEFYRATTQALQGFVSDRLNLQTTDFSIVNVEKDMRKVNVGDDEVVEYLSCLQESDFRRYSGSGSKAEELKSFYERIRKILTRLEKYI